MRAWTLNNTIRTPLLLVGLSETMVLVSAVYVSAIFAFGSVEACQSALGSLAPKAAVIAVFCLVSLFAIGL